jgi:hypothetical protein
MRNCWPKGSTEKKKPEGYEEISDGEEILEVDLDVTYVGK